MARRYDHSRDEIREMALAAAAALLESGGIDAITTRRVAQAIGYAPGTLYNVFEDLDDLKLHLNGRSLDQLHRALVHARGESEATQGLEIADAVMMLARTQLSFVEDHPAAWRLLFRHRPAPDQRVPDWYVAKIGETMEELVHVLTPLFPGEIGECRRLARTLWASFFGICEISNFETLDLIPRKEVEAMTELLIRSTLRGIAKDKETGEETT